MSPTKAQSVSMTATRPLVAVELALEGVLAATVTGRGEPPVLAFAPLHGGVLTPGIEETNVRSPEMLSVAISAALNDVQAKTRDVTLIVPDTAVRVFVLDFDSLPSKPAEVLPVLRFRLRKMVPFDVEHAGVSYQVLSTSASETRALIAVIPGPILKEYEDAVRASGYEPGVVLPSSLAALGAVDSAEPVLAACLSSGALTTVITHGQDLLLYRTLDLPDDPAQRLADAQRDIAVAAAYYEDKLGVRARKLHFGGVGSAEDFGHWLQVNDPELSVVELVPRPSRGAATNLGRLSFAGITGALAGVA